MRPFLATTALSEFWDAQAEKILFLGQWCMRYDKKKDWQNLHYEVLPYPWDDRKAMHRAAAYEEETANLLLDALADFLNHIHGVKHPVHYWRIILFPWIIHYVQVLHERYLCLRQAHDLHPDCRTIGLAPSAFNIPRFLGDHLIGSMDDHYNLQIYTQLMLAMGYRPEFKYYNWNWQQIQLDSGINKKMRFRELKTIIREQTLKLIKWSVRGQILMVDMYLPRKQVLQIMWRSGLNARVAMLPRNDAKVWQLENGQHYQRGELANLSIKHADEFQKILINTLPHNFPLFYLEVYDICRAWAEMQLQKSRTRMMITSSAIEGNEPYKFLCATAKEKGVKLIGIQHGGHYGSALYNPFENYERQASDEFWTWGWGEENNGIKHMPNPKLSRLAAARKAKDKTAVKYIFFIGNNTPRYHYRTWSCPTANQTLQYLNWQITFLKSLMPTVKERIIFRPYHTDYGWSIRQRVKDNCHDITISEQSDNYNGRLLGATLIICDANQTTLLESIAANIPLIAFWNPRLWELRSGATPLYEHLKEAGILYLSPVDAARAVNRIWPNVDEWWNEKHRQTALRLFASHFAFSAGDWIEKWNDQLNICCSRIS